MLKNLIRNPCGEEGLDHWQAVQNGGDGWKVENDVGIPEYPYHMKYFAASFQQCSKTQVIDLLKHGYSNEFLDSQPNIMISDWYATRNDSGSSYELQVQLLSESHSVISEFSIKHTAIPESDFSFNQVSHTFIKYGPGVRFIKFTNGGKSLKNWKGWYGVRVTGSSVTIN
ncbi:F-box only protein 2-like [Engystomops pustulosus]|uniref:F-box only protein 2-like n=1 Tax=Engystomops pustulosus TaxID=76066 RepID=UPI003AFA51A9